MHYLIIFIAFFSLFSQNKVSWPLSVVAFVSSMILSSSVTISYIGEGKVCSWIDVKSMSVNQSWARISFTLFVFPILWCWLVVINLTIRSQHSPESIGYLFVNFLDVIASRLKEMLFSCFFNIFSNAQHISSNHQK